MFTEFGKSIVVCALRKGLCNELRGVPCVLLLTFVSGLILFNVATMELCS